MLGMPVSEVLHTAIELWHDLEIDDDELMEIVIKEVSYHISIKPPDGEEDQHEAELSSPLSQHATGTPYYDSSSHYYPCGDEDDDANIFNPRSLEGHPMIIAPFSNDSHVNQNRAPEVRRFNPKKDSTVLHLEMKHLSCQLDHFKFRLEPSQSRATTIFDPVFEGTGTLTIKDLSLTLGIECRKERFSSKRSGEGGDDPDCSATSSEAVPVLQVQELDVSLDEVKLKFSNTGLDWLLNPILKGLREGMTEVIEATLREQLELQIHEALEKANSYIESNPSLLLHVLGCSLDDLEENVVWV
jgi:hypothetical protein